MEVGSVLMLSEETEGEEGEDLFTDSRSEEKVFEWNIPMWERNRCGGRPRARPD